MKNLERIFFAFYIPIGLWACLNSGVSWDELTEYQTLNINLQAVKGFWSGSLIEYQKLLNYGDRYYGIGFHLVSNVVAKFALFINDHLISLSHAPSEILFAHIAVFGAFVLSGLFVKSILYSLADNSPMAILGMIAYLLWPYLLGHSFFNVKDIPFLFVWILATSIYLNILQLWHSGFLLSKKRITVQFAIFGLCTAWLLSIRVSGVMIFIEYAVFLMVYLLMGGCLIKRILTPGYILAFAISFVLGLFFLSPVYWHNPLEFLNAISYMSHHPWDGDTLTAGKLLGPKQFNLFYIPAWLLIKLPVFVLLGWMLIPFVLYKAIKKQAIYINGTALLNLTSLILTIVSILLFLLLLKAGLYNELRQILFIFPLIYIVGFCGLYYASKKLLAIALVITALIFAADNIALYPYQYTYMNEASRQIDIGNRYEKDYFSLSASRNAAWLNQNYSADKNVACVFVSPAHLWGNLDKTKYPCVKGYLNFASSIHPFIFSWLIRDRADLLPLPTCKLIHEERVSLPLSYTQLVMSQVFFCNPVFTEK